MSLTPDSLKIATSLRAPQISAIKNETNFLKHINFFTNNTPSYQAARQELYEEVQTMQGFTGINEAKWHILKSLFAPYFIQQTQLALNYANKGQGFLAGDAIEELKKLEPIFKPLYDVSNFSGFIQEIDSKMDGVQAHAIFGEADFELSSDSLDKLSKTILGQLKHEAPGIASANDFIQKVVTHPLMYCLDLFQDRKTFLNNLSEGIINLGEYHNLAVAILKLKEEKNSEKYDALIMYLITKDREDGLKNIALNSSHPAKYLHKFLNVINQGIRPTNYEMEKLIEEVLAKSKNFEITTKDLESRSTSKFSMNDSGFEVKDLNGNLFFFHIHTASGKGEKQLSQQAGTTNAFRKNDKYSSTVSVSIMDKHIMESSGNGYLKDYEEGFDSLTDFDRYFMSTLQFDKNYLAVLANNLRQDNTLNLKTTNILNKNVSVIRTEEIMPCIEKYLIKRCASNDEEIIASNAKQLVRIAKDYGDTFSSLFKTTATQGQIRYEILHEPFLANIKNILQIQKHSNVEFLSSSDLEILTPLIKSSMLATEVTINTISGDISDIIEILKNKKQKFEIPNSSAFDELSDSYQLKKEYVSIFAQAFDEKQELVNKVANSVSPVGPQLVSNFDFTKTEYNSSDMKKLVSYFSGRPEEIKHEAKNIKKVILKYSGDYNNKNTTKLENAIENFKDALRDQELCKGEDIEITPGSWGAGHPKVAKVITTLMLPNKMGASHGIRKSKEEKEFHLLLANLFCLYIKTENVGLKYASNKASSLKKMVKEVNNLKTKFKD